MREQKDRRDGGRARRGPGTTRPDAAGPVAPRSSSAVTALQRLAGNAAVARLLSVQPSAGTGTEEHDPTVQRQRVERVLRSAGRPLDEPVRTEWEARYGTDLSDVRIHTDTSAHQAAASVQAEAFTSGTHIAFQQGRFAPNTGTGKKLLGHELAHVNQQRSGPVPGTDNGNGLSMSDPADTHEKAADAEADAALQRRVEDA